jgi:hypothetical protein
LDTENVIGSLYPARINRPVTRFEQKTMRTVIGDVPAAQSTPASDLPF